MLRGLGFGTLGIDSVLPLVSSNPNSVGALFDPGFPLSSSVDTLCTSVFLVCSK